LSQATGSELATLAAALGDAVTPALAEQLMKYLDLLARWNGTYNLTAVRSRDGMLLQHLADCLAVVQPLRKHLHKYLHKSCHGMPAPVRLLDVGSGGGLPGVVLAACMPALQVTCVDTVAKKAAFVRQVAAELALPNLYSAHSRVETLKAPAFQLITSRAFASLADFTRLTGSLLAPDGTWLAMKGKTPLDEIAALPSALEVFHVEPLQVPGLDAQRCLVWIRNRKLE